MAGQKKHNKPNNRLNKNKSNSGNYNKQPWGKEQNKSRNQDNRNRNRNYDNQHSNSKGQPNQSSTAEGKQSRPQAQSKTESSNDLLFFIIFLVALAGFFLARRFYFPAEKTGIYSSFSNIGFMKEGKLTFRDGQSDEVIIGIDIEVAKSNYEIEQGLMYRKSLPANAGMLFIFSEENYRTFWMKNTYMSLDILFLNAEKEIIRICKNATPLSEVSIPSGGKAQYVVEVLGDFTDAYQIHLGDRIDFQY